LGGSAAKGEQGSTELLSVKSSASKGVKGSKTSKGFSRNNRTTSVDLSFGGHFVVSPKLASLVYLRKPKLSDIPNYPFVGRSRRNRRYSPGAKGGSTTYIASTNKEVHARVVAFCSR
jgi:hypothetical protein